MNIIEHLTRTVTPIVLGNLQGNQAGDRPSLLEKVYAIIIARLADNNISTPFASRTIANDDPSFFDSLLPEANHRSSMVQELAKHYSVPEDETQSLIHRAAPLAYNELRNLAGTTPLATFLNNNISSVASVLPAWAYAFIPAGILTALNLTPAHATTTNVRPEPVVATTTRVNEQLVATPKQEGGLMKTLLPIIGLLILAALAWALLKSCNKQPEPVAAPMNASTAASTVVVTAASTPVETVVVPGSTASATVTDSTVVVASAGTGTMATGTVVPSTSTTVISTTEPSVLFENGRLSFYFVTGKSDVAPGAVDKAQEILAAAKQGKKIGISGYTDSTGSAAANEALAKKRAQAVKKFLMDNGVPESQLDLRKPDDTVGAAGKDQEGRRVDAYIIESPDVVTQTVVTAPAAKP